MLAVTEIAATLLKSDRPPSQDKVLKILEDANQHNSTHGSNDWENIVSSMKEGWEQNTSLSDFLISIGGNPNHGISGYAYLNYASALAEDLPIGSGEVESGHRSVLQKRPKKPGGWWTMENAEAMAHLKTLQANCLWGDFWEKIAA